MTVFAAYEAHNSKELLAGLEEKADYILIKGDYFKEVKKIMDTHLSDCERLSMEVGGGPMTVLIYAIDKVLDLFGNEDKKDKKIDQKLKLYKVKKITNQDLLLSLRQVDY